MDSRSNSQRIREKNGILYLGNRMMGESIEIPTAQIKKVKENFPVITITLTKNKKLRIDGKNMTTKIYSCFLETLRKHEILNTEKNIEQNKSVVTTPRKRSV